MKNVAKNVAKVAVIIVAVNILVSCFILVVMPMLGEGANMLLGLIGYVIGLIFSILVWFVILFIPASLVYFGFRFFKKITSK